MDNYDFSNGPHAIKSFERFSGKVSDCLNNIDKSLKEIIQKKQKNPKRFIGYKIQQFAELYPSEEITEDMKFLNKARVCLQHGKLNRDMPNSDLECTHNNETIRITGELVEEFRSRYIRVHNRLIEIKRIK